MSRAELNYADGLSFGIDISELARPEVLHKIVSFVGAERGWIGLLDGGDRAIERIVTSTMMPDRGNMSALKAISKIILSSCRERESDGWHLCTLRSINPSEAVYLAPNCAHAEDGRLYSFSEFVFDADRRVVCFFEFPLTLRSDISSIRQKLSHLGMELGNSINVLSKIAQQSTSITVEMFDYLGIAAAIAMGAGLEVARSNRAFRPYLPESGRLRSEPARLGQSVDGMRDGRIVAALTRLAASLREPAADAPSQHFIPIPAQGELSPLLMHVIRDDDHLISGPLAVPTFLVLVTRVVRPAVPKEDVLQKLFAMTGAEARVARSIAAGEKLEEIAVKTGVTVGTVRFHLKGVFAKTGLDRQADLVGLLSGLSVSRCPK
ncbi:helix-turn-helix transcriptional regulator [Methylorubrum sp. B1-46]|uniref:helix-turn-helix transcriptional regulator n=1 Tax=Methylorubrum sp. B1-46 TaxID=2897334 RepID=UPI001E453C61|nr:helix-turn-helix transcriptional regulator [Methylorubrum sp. B1-46]UGB27289.1 helix-turn-helix transcriptional regulator [Methylorubrum sp. B1-46]